MIYVIRVRGVYHGKRFEGWKIRAGAFVASAVLGASLVGALLGLAGAAIPGNLRTTIAVALAIAGILLAAAELSGRRVWLLQRNRETSQRWMRFGPLLNSAMNGMSMGVGFVTRIGYWLWYAIPVAALLSGSWRLGAGLFFAYALVRAGLVTVIAALDEVGHRPSHRSQDELASLSRRMRLSSSFFLLFLCVTYAVGVAT